MGKIEKFYFPNFKHFYISEGMLGPKTALPNDPDSLTEPALAKDPDPVREPALANIRIQ